MASSRSGRQRDGGADVLQQQRAAPLQGRERRPPGLDEQLALVGVVGDEHLRALRHARRLHDRDLLAAGCSGGVGLRDEQGARAAVQAHRLVVLDRVDARAVHQLEHRRAQHRAHRDDGVCGLPHGGEARDQRGPGGLSGDEPEGGAGDDAESALAPDEQLEQRQPGDVLDPLAPELHERAVGEHHVEAEHVVGGDAVLDAAQAARVGRHVAADRADLERGRIGRIPEAVLGGRPLDVGVESPRLRDRHLRGRVDLDRAHPFQADHQAAVDGRRAAGQAAARPSRHDADVVGRSPAHRGLHLACVLRPHHRHGYAGRLVARPVEAVLLHRVGLRHHHAVGQRGDQVLDGRLHCSHAAHATT